MLFAFSFAEDTEEKQSIQCFVVGDSDVGKTFCLYTFTTKSYPNEYTSRSFSDLKVSVEAEGKNLSLLLCDSSGRRDYAQFRKLVYPKTDVVVLCFAVNSPESMSNVRTYWYPEVSSSVFYSIYLNRSSSGLCDRSTCFICSKRNILQLKLSSFHLASCSR